jgi:hypothetical protein
MRNGVCPGAQDERNGLELLSQAFDLGVQVRLIQPCLALSVQLDPLSMTAHRFSWRRSSSRGRSGPKRSSRAW